LRGYTIWDAVYPTLVATVCLPDRTVRLGLWIGIVDTVCDLYGCDHVAYKICTY